MPGAWSLESGVWSLEPCLSLPSPHMGKQNHFAYRRRVRQHHHQSVNADAFAGGWGETVFERADVVVVHGVRIGVAAALFFELLLESAPLFERIVQLAEGVRDFEAGDVQLEAFDRLWVVRLLLRERRYLGREVVDERRLDERRFAERFEDLHRQLARAAPRCDRDVEACSDGGG